MAQLGNGQMFSCTEAYCFEGQVYPRKIDYGKKIDLGISLSRVWLIRPGWHLEVVSEQEIVEHLEENGIEAMWVDSESDARAMAMEETA